MPRPATILTLLCAFTGASAASAGPSRTQDAHVRFVEVAAARGLLGYQNEGGQGSGLACADFDDDGDVDCYVPQAGGRADHLYVNMGDGHFVEDAARRGLARLAESRVALWLDYDNDGDLDLLVANDDEDETSSFYLYRQDHPYQFTDVTAAAGLVKAPVPIISPLWWGGLCAGDIDNDGFLDVYSGQWGGPAHLFLNNGDGTFADISFSSGVTYPGDETFRHQPVMHDFDGDGWMDIFAAVDFGPNELWINRRDHTFENRAPAAGLDNSMEDMGVALGDYDNDGDLDVYITNIVRNGNHNVLLRNDSAPDTLRYVEVSKAMGVDDGRWGWGATWMDADNDGDLDLPTVNGWYVVGWATDTSRFFVNREAGALPFLEEAAQAGFADTDWGSALAAVDFDRDGDLDLLQTCMASHMTSSRLRLHDNQSVLPAGAANWLLVRPRIDGPNRHAIGAVVRASGGGRSMMRLITAGTSYSTQEPAEAFFGAGAATHLDLTVEWPGGGVSVLEDVAVNQVITVTRPAPPPVQVVVREVTPARVRLGWVFEDLANHSVTIERREGSSPWSALDQRTTDASGVCDFEDAGIVPGTTYRYRLSFTLQGMPFRLGEVAVPVPPAELALAGAVPNPSAAGLQVRFSLLAGARATLALMDLGGRTLRRIEVGGLGPGSHTVDLGTGLDLEPGIYWVRLEQAGRALTRKAALIP